MIRINLLPHREARRKQNRIAFFRMLALSAAFAAVVVLAVAVFIATKISDQTQRNDFFKAENKKLEDQIAQIATLEEEIKGLKARQQAVEDLQSDRNQPVYLLDELVKQVPEGIFLRSFKQEGQKVSMTGVAQSNERVSELLHNFSNNSPWLERPELIESKAGTIGQGRDSKKVFEFTVSVAIKRLRDKESKDGTPAGNSPASTGNAGKDKSAAQSSAAAGMPADKTVAPTEKPPTTGDKAAAVKGAPNAVASGAAVDAPKKP